jgi:hypothetical protein
VEITVASVGHTMVVEVGVSRNGGRQQWVAGAMPFAAWLCACTYRLASLYLYYRSTPSPKVAEDRSPVLVLCVP